MSRFRAFNSLHLLHIALVFHSSDMGVFRGGRGPPPNRKKFSTPFKYSLSWFLPNHVYNLWRIAW